MQHSLDYNWVNDYNNNIAAKVKLGIFTASAVAQWIINNRVNAYHTGIQSLTLTHGGMFLLFGF